MPLHLRIFDKYTWPLSLFYTLIVTSALFFPFSFELTHFDTLLPGIATSNLIDINQRVNTFRRIVVALPIIFITLNLLFASINRLLSDKQLLAFLNYTALLGTGLFMLRLLTKNHEASVYLIIALHLCFTFYSLLFQSRSSYSQFGKLAITTFALTFFIREVEIIIFNISLSTPFIILGVFSFIGVCLLTFFLRNKKMGVPNFAFAFMLAFPIISLFSDEIYLIFNQRNIAFLSPDKLYLLFIGLLSIGFVLRIKLKPDARKRYSLYPFLITGLVAFAFYLPVIPQPTEMFELANPANAIMRMFRFHEFPFVDFMNSHVVWEWSFKSLYVLLNGYSGTSDFLIYDFIDTVLFYLAAWWLFKTFFKNQRFALLTIVLVPFLPVIVYQTMYFVIFNLWFLLLLKDKFTIRNLLLNFIWISFSLFWRLDSGIASAAASMVVLLFILIKQNTKEKRLIFIKAAGLFGGAVMLFFASAYFIWGDVFFTSIKQALSYFGAAQAHGLPDVSAETNRYLFNSYFIFPAIVLSIGFVMLYQLANDKSKNPRITNHLIIFFLAVVYLVNIPRGLVRHSLLGSGDSFVNSFFFLIVLLFIYQLIKNKNQARWTFLALSILVVPNFKFHGALDYENLFQQFNQSFTQVNHIEKQGDKIVRCVPNNQHSKTTYAGFVEFMNQNFDSSATFIDFSNTPMLYFYSQRNVPSYFCQYMQNTVTPYLQTKNLEYVQLFNVPVVVFSHIPAQWWDATDGVPNTIRYNKIAQYIYNNYQPLGNVNGYWLWLKNDVKLRNNALVKSYQPKPEKYNLKYYPFALAQNQACHGHQYLKQTLPINNDTIQLPASNQHKAVYLQLNIESTSSKIVEVFYGDSVAAGSFVFETVEKASINSYSIPLSSQFSWLNNSYARIWFNADKAVKLATAELITEVNEVENQ